MVYRMVLIILCSDAISGLLNVQELRGEVSPVLAAARLLPLLIYGVNRLCAIRIRSHPAGRLVRASSW